MLDFKPVISIHLSLIKNKSTDSDNKTNLIIVIYLDLFLHCLTKIKPKITFLQYFT